MKLLIYLLLLLFPFQNIHLYKVVSILDGDTIEILDKDKNITRVRLSAIDCPEKVQAFGTKAKEKTAELCFGKMVTIEVMGHDKYGRTLAFIILPDGRILNNELVKLGYAWHYKRYSNDENLAQLESKARKEKVGLWIDEHYQAPWEFRKK